MFEMFLKHANILSWKTQKEVKIMKAQTIKQIFKTVADNNNVMEVIGNYASTCDIIIYIDTCKYYVGTSYKELMKQIKKEYVKEFVEEFENILFCGYMKQKLTVTLNKNTPYESTHYHIVEIMIG